MRIPSAAGLCLALMLTLPATARAQGSNAGLTRFNQELSDIWAKLRPGLENRLRTEANTNLLGLRHSSGPFELKVERIRRLRIDIDPAPGFEQLDPHRLQIRVPSAGHWKIEIEVRIRVRFRLGFIRTRFRIPVTLRVSRLRARVGVNMDVSDPTWPTVQRIDRPDVSFRVRVRSRHFLTDVLFRLLSPIGNHLAHSALGDALRGLTPQLSNLSGLPGPSPGAGTPPLQDTGTPTPFREIATNVDAKIRRDHMPYGTILRANMSVPAQASWLDAYRNGGSGNVGQIDSYDGGGDSAIFTGHYLAAAAHRYHATGEQVALDNVRFTLQGIGNLLDIHQGRGLLARVAAPETSAVAQSNIIPRGISGREMLHGQWWVARTDQGSGGKGISRDQYSGVFYGLGVAHDFVSDPGVQADAALRIQQMLDYLITNRWIIDEDRVAFTGADRKGFPTFWFGVPHQKLTFLILGERVAPGRYAVDLAREGPLASTAWLGTFMGTFNLHHYYRFNLQMITFFNYFRLESDPTRWQDMHRAYQITQRHVGHHHSPHFDLIQTSIDPSLSATLFPSIREAMRQYLTRNHREVAPPVVDLSGVSWVNVVQPRFDLTSLSIPGLPSGSSSSGSNTIRMPSAPLDIPLRRYTGHFMWQKNPFEPARAGVGDPKGETTGVDLVLPYWHGLDQGAF